MWVQFHDMHSGGGQKLEWAQIFIEAASEDEGKIIFYNKFGRNPERVTCTCCGEDYSISTNESLAQITAFNRGCKYIKGSSDKRGYYIENDEAVPEGADLNVPWHKKYLTLADYVKSKDVKVIYASQIKPSEKVGSVPAEGYVWAGDDD